MLPSFFSSFTSPFFSIFSPFFSTKQGGTGLGLSVSRQIIQAHRGSLSLESAPGKGTTFVMRLPKG